MYACAHIRMYVQICIQKHAHKHTHILFWILLKVAHIAAYKFGAGKWFLLSITLRWACTLPPFVVAWKTNIYVLVRSKQLNETGGKRLNETGLCACVWACVRVCTYMHAEREREWTQRQSERDEREHFLAATCACVKEMTHIFRDDRVRDDLHMMGDIWIVEVVNFGQYTLKWYIYIFRRYRHMRKLPLETEVVSHRNRVRERRCQMDTAK